MQIDPSVVLIGDGNGEEVHPHQEVGEGQISKVKGVNDVVGGGEETSQQHDQISGATDGSHYPDAGTGEGVRVTGAGGSHLALSTGLSNRCSRLEMPSPLGWHTLTCKALSQSSNRSKCLEMDEG